MFRAFEVLRRLKKNYEKKMKARDLSCMNVNERVSRVSI